MRFIFGIILFYTIQPLVASDFNHYITIQEKEESKFLHQTVRKYGDITRFEVIIGDKDISNAPFDTPVTRKLRLFLNCERKEFSVVLTTLFDRNGMKMKSLVAPPGTETYVKPSNEIETKWMERACDTSVR